MSRSADKPALIAERLSGRMRRSQRAAGIAHWRRETFALPRPEARAKAKEFFARFPKAAYMTEVEHWRELPDGRIEFTMRRLPSAD
jgi:hypothetical protein